MSDSEKFALFYMTLSQILVEIQSLVYQISSLPSSSLKKVQFLEELEHVIDHLEKLLPFPYNSSMNGSS